MGRKIKGIAISRMPNGAHYTFVKNTLEWAEECEAVAGRLSADIATLRTAFRGEEAALRVMRKSGLTKEIVRGDAMRDSSYSGYKGAVRGLLSLPEGKMQTAARRLWDHIKSCRIVTTDQRDKQTGMMTSFIESLEGKYAADIAMLGLSSLVVAMKEANEKVYVLMKDRDTEYSTKTVGGVKAARLATDEAYRTLIDKVNAMALLEGDADCAELIDAMNAQIARYKREVLARKSAKAEEDAGDEEAK